MLGIIERRNGNSLTLERVFEAPRALVYRFFTEPRFVQRWWGVKDSTVAFCALDVRPGGEWRIDMEVPSGAIYRNYGVFLEVSPDERLTYTDVPDPEAPHWQGKVPESGVHLITFADAPHGTTVTLEIRRATAEEMARFADLGVRNGWSECFDRLEQALAEH